MEAVRCSQARMFPVSCSSCKQSHSCSMQHCVAQCRKQFTLHGLWPNLDNSCPEDYPEHCSDEAFSFDNIPQPLQKRMGVDWPSYKNCEYVCMALRMGPPAQACMATMQPCTEECNAALPPQRTSASTHTSG